RQPGAGDGKKGRPPPFQGAVSDRYYCTPFSWSQVFASFAKNELKNKLAPTGRDVILRTLLTKRILVVVGVLLCLFLCFAFVGAPNRRLKKKKTLFLRVFCFTLQQFTELFTKLCTLCSM
ncbi:unnamed protein product, partial [Pylaiella littoralis]